MQVRGIAALAFLTAANAPAPGCSPGGVMPAAAGSVAVTPHQTTVGLGGTVAFTAVVTGEATPNVTWSVPEAGGGTVDASGKYAAPANTGTFHVVANSVADRSKSDTATVTVMPIIAVNLLPKNASTTTGGKIAFSATVSGTTSGQSTAVRWSVQEPGGGAVDATGLYVAPANAGTFHVIAASVADPTKSDVATVAVTATPVVTVSLSPKTAATTTGRVLTFTAVVTGTVAGQSTGVTWSVQEAGGGTVDTSGHYTAPGTAGTFHVIATSVADTTKADTATVTVTAIAVAISPKTATTTTGSALTFSAVVTGTVAGQSTGVTWSVQEAGGGTVDTSGHYTAPGTAGTFHVIATSAADTTKRDTATVTVASVVAISAVSPVNAFACEPVQLAATVTGTSDTVVLWSVPAACGTITAIGVFTPARGTTTCVVTAQAHADLSKLASITVNVALERVLSVAVVPASATLAPGGTLAFAANVTTACGTFPAGQ
jgi:hypothetical protein